MIPSIHTKRYRDYHKDKSALRCPQWGARRDSHYTLQVQSIRAVQTWNTQSTKLQSQGWLHLPRRRESCWLHLYRRWESHQSVYSTQKFKSYKEDSSHRQWCWLKSRRFKSQNLNDIISWMVTLLLAADILLNRLLRLCRLQRRIHSSHARSPPQRCREGIHSQESTFHGVTSKTSHTFMVSTQTQSEISNVV